jgi:hemoglobin
MEANTQTTLFARIGGMGAVNAAVDIFYQKVIHDNRVNHFFRHIDIEKQAGKLKAFMAYAFGAPLPYSGKALREAHQHMHLTEVHFNAVAEHLLSTLHELKVPQALIDEVVTVVLTTKKDVLNL